MQLFAISAILAISAMHFARPVNDGVKCAAVRLIDISAMQPNAMTKFPIFSVRLWPLIKEDDLIFRSSYEFDELCSRNISSFEPNIVTMKNGKSYQIPERGGQLEEIHGPLKEIIQNADGPKIHGAIFESAAPVDRVSTGVRYIGLWSKGHESILATFTNGDSRAKIIAKIPMIAKGVSYFPAADTAAGAIGLIERRGSGVRLHTLSWYHRNWSW